MAAIDPGEAGAIKGPWSLSRITAGPSAFLPDRVVLRGVGDGRQQPHPLLHFAGMAMVASIACVVMAVFGRERVADQRLNRWDEAFAYLATFTTCLEGSAQLTAIIPVSTWSEFVTA